MLIFILSRRFIAYDVGDMFITRDAPHTPRAPRYAPCCIMLPYLAPRHATLLLSTFCYIAYEAPAMALADARQSCRLATTARHYFHAITRFSFMPLFPSGCGFLLLARRTCLRLFIDDAYCAACSHLLPLILFTPPDFAIFFMPPLRYFDSHDFLAFPVSI